HGCEYSLVQCNRVCVVSRHDNAIAPEPGWIKSRAGVWTIHNHHKRLTWFDNIFSYCSYNAVMKKPVCLVIDPMHESLFEMMSEIGWDVDYRPEIKRDEIRKIHHDYDGLIVRSKTIINRDLLGDAPSLKVIGRAGAGLDNLELDFLAAHGIQVVHASEGNRDAVGE